MDNRPTQTPVSQTNAAQPDKQQVTEVLRQAANVVVTTHNRPTVDQIASVLALSQILTKMGKRAEAVISSSIPDYLNFLPVNLVKKQFEGVRDFIIKLDVSKVEADKLKYVPEGKQLKIYITPYNGNFKKDDVTIDYGDYQCDAVVALGVIHDQDLDQTVASQQKLVEKAKLVTITAGTADKNLSAIGWSEPTASSVCEMLMSITEAIQPGVVDQEIATMLLTGIVANTNHFTAANTTPKVMTMAAQLLAGGARQAEIIQRLQATVSLEASPMPASQVSSKQPQRTRSKSSAKQKSAESSKGKPYKLPEQINEVKSDVQIAEAESGSRYTPLAELVDNGSSQLRPNQAIPPLTHQEPVSQVAFSGPEPKPITPPVEPQPIANQPVIPPLSDNQPSSLDLSADQVSSQIKKEHIMPADNLNGASFQTSFNTNPNAIPPNGQPQMPDAQTSPSLESSQPINPLPVQGQVLDQQPAAESLLPSSNGPDLDAARRAVAEAAANNDPNAQKQDIEKRFHQAGNQHNEQPPVPPV